MAAYIVAQATPKDPDKMQEYGRAAGPTLAVYGGKLVVGGPLQTLYGETPHERIVVLEFPDAEAAKNWYHSEEYQSLLPLRTEAMDSVFILGGE